MNPRVRRVQPAENYTLLIEFTNGERRLFDVKPYLDKGIFRSLQEKQLFNSVRVVLGSVQWRDGQDLCPDTLYLDSIPVSEEHERTAVSNMP